MSALRLRTLLLISTAGISLTGLAVLAGVPAGKPAARKASEAAKSKAAASAPQKPVAPAAAAPDPVDEKFARLTERLWSLQPVKRADVPAGVTQSSNPIDAFIAETYKEKGLRPVPKADRATLLRRVSFDLVGLPPTPEEIQAFVSDESPDAYSKVVRHLLESPQYGVRWARHWLDVLRYADQDGGMPASSGLYLWREWVINSLNADVPYDDFARAQILGNRSREHTMLTATGYRVRVPAVMQDSFALGFLARNALTQDDKEQDLALNAVETVSTAFMGMTVGCAKCHDHKFDPIRQKDFYAMKALFDPLVLRKIPLAHPDEIFANGKASQDIIAKKAPIDKAIEKLIGPYRTKLYEERMASLPADAQAAIRKETWERSREEQKLADDYYPILRIDAVKVKEIMTPEDLKLYEDLLRQQGSMGRQGDLPSYYIVEEDPLRLTQPSYILTTGDPMRPEKDKPVEPGFPFKPKHIDFREGRREGFVDWLTAPENPLFARVAVNRVWAWHFGEGLQRVTSDLGLLGGTPVNRKLLDYLAAEFVSHNYSMKWLHELIVTSDVYQLSSKAEPELISANEKVDARNSYLWRFRLQRKDAESIWDGILSAANDLDLSVGGKSFQLRAADARRPGGAVGGGRGGASFDNRTNRRGAYMARGYSGAAEVMPNFLVTFDVEDGRTACPIRTQTVTAPQALFTMNDEVIENETGKFADRVLKDSGGDLNKAVKLAFALTLGREPAGSELDRSLTYVASDPKRIKGLAWLLFNLDEFIYVR